MLRTFSHNMQVGKAGYFESSFYSIPQLICITILVVFTNVNYVVLCIFRTVFNLCYVNLLRSTGCLLPVD
jgi:hypothetical protein